MEHGNIHMPFVKQTAGGNLLHDTGARSPCSVTAGRLDGQDGGWEGGLRGRDMCVPVAKRGCMPETICTQYCKAIIFQLNK